LTLTQLTYIVAVDTHRHFGRAAEACHVSQPTLSAQIQKLEDDLGVVIFDRSFSPVRPTDLGARVIEQARLVLVERDRIGELLSEASDTVTGDLRIGIIPTLAAYLLPMVTAIFMERYPEINLVVEDMTTERILDALANHRIDMGLIATEEHRAGLESQALFDEPFVAYVGRNHRLASRKQIRPRDLVDEDIWLLQEEHCFRDQVLQICGQDPAHNNAAHIRFESGSLETLRHLVDRVGGITLLPYLATQYLDRKAKSNVRNFASPQPSRQVRTISRRAYARRPLIDAYAGVVRDVVQKPLSVDS
jgi:LysR family hydrogen peroxide-inducible transcriptional activator